MSWIETVNRFWFEELRPDAWFGGGIEVDELIRARFGTLYAELKRNPPPADSLDATGHLAAIIVFDQFPRNLFRDSKAAYDTDRLALAYARHAIDRGLDRELETQGRHFIYMPFMHSEDRDTQRRSLELFTQLGDSGTLGYARHHHDVVARFGRFPHRNAILGRVSTPMELEFLRGEQR